VARAPAQGTGLELERAKGLLPIAAVAKGRTHGMDSGGAEILTVAWPRCRSAGCKAAAAETPHRQAGGKPSRLAIARQQPLQAAVIGRQVLVFDRPAGAVPHLAGSRLELS